jgi:hypothetical protein
LVDCSGTPPEVVVGLAVPEVRLMVAEETVVPLAEAEGEAETEVEALRVTEPVDEAVAEAEPEEEEDSVPSPPVKGNWPEKLGVAPCWRISRA